MQRLQVLFSASGHWRRLGILFHCRVAEKFFLAVKNQDTKQAQRYLSAQFQSTTSASQLQQHLRKKNLNDYESASWDRRSISGHSAELDSHISTSMGDVPVNLSFYKN